MFAPRLFSVKTIVLVCTEEWETLLQPFFTQKLSYMILCICSGVKIMYILVLGSFSYRAVEYSRN